MDTTAEPAVSNFFKDILQHHDSQACPKETVLVMHGNTMPEIHDTDIELFYRPDVGQYQASVCHGGVLLFIIAVDRDEEACQKITEQWKLDHKKNWPVKKIETPAYYSVS